MNTKVKNIVQTALFALILFGFAFTCWFKEHREFSEDERRVLATFPEISAETLFNREFMSEFDVYTQDQFPLRDTFRSIKSLSQFYIFNRAESNDLYMADGHISCSMIH